MKNTIQITDIPEEVLFNILRYTSSSVNYINFCKALRRKVNQRQFLALHSKTVVDTDGTIKTYLDGLLHSIDDRPAIVYKDGRREWYKYGNLHRDGDKPAIITNETQIWYKDGLKHRGNGEPAEIWKSGRKYWYIKDELKGYSY